MAENRLSVPSGSGGLMRYNEEYPSKLKLKPSHVIIFIIAVILLVAIFKLILPIK